MDVLKKILSVSLLLSVAMGAVAQDGDTAPTARTDIHPEPEMAQPLMPGMKAPAFTVLDPKGEKVSFDPDQLSKPLIITFYRGGWCPYCNLHLSEMRHAEAEIEKMGYDIWFISVDQPSVLEASLEEPDLKYRVLSDSDLDAIRAFGIAFRLPEETVEKYREYGVDLEEASGRDHHVLPVPSTFIIGQDGVIRFAYSNPEYSVRLSPEVLLAAAEAHKTDIDDRLRKAYKAQKEASE